MEDAQIAILAEVCRASHQLKVAAATLMGIAGAGALNDLEVTAALTNGIMKLSEPDDQATVNLIQKLLIADRRDSKKFPGRNEPLSVTVRQELKMEFNSLDSVIRQIESASKRGYSDPEIKEALLNSIPRDLPIKHYLEVAQLDLQETCRVIQQYFKEPSASELFATLSKMTQMADEAATTFMMRLLEKRERLKLAAKQSKEASYPDSLIDSTYRQALVTGLADVELRIAVRALLKTNATDHEIMEEMNLLSSSSLKRERVHCDALRAEQQLVAADQTEPREWKKSEGTAKIVDQLNAKIQALEAQMMTNPSQVVGGASNNKYRCDSCRHYRKKRSSHCWRCGSESHLQHDCKSGVRKGQQGNGDGSR